MIMLLRLLVILLLSITFAPNLAREKRWADRIVDALTKTVTE